MADNTAYSQTLEEFRNYLTGILRIYEDAIPVIAEEFTAISEGDIALLDENLKKQQAIFLKTRLFDETVADYHRRLGLEASGLRELVPRLPEEQRAGFEDLIGNFDAVISELSFYRSKCKTLLQGKLFLIEKKLGAFGSIETTTYKADATETGNNLLPKTFQTTV